MADIQGVSDETVAELRRLLETQPAVPKVGDVVFTSEHGDVWRISRIDGDEVWLSVTLAAPIERICYTVRFGEDAVAEAVDE